MKVKGFGPYSAVNSEIEKVNDDIKIWSELSSVVVHNVMIFQEDITVSDEPGLLPHQEKGYRFLVWYEERVRGAAYPISKTN